MKYNCLIVDDERPALKLLKAYIQKLPHLEVTAACENALTAMAALQNHTVDILFLDIQMPDLSGLDLLKVLKEKPQVILTTAPIFDKQRIVFGGIYSRSGTVNQIHIN